MRWVIDTKDSRIKEGDMEFKEVDRSIVQSVSMYESSNSLVPYDCNSGILRFNDLDLTKFDEFCEGQKLLLEFDKQRGYFKLTKNSLKLLQNIQKPEEYSYYFGFDQFGNIDLNTNKMNLGILLSGETVLFNTNVFDTLIQFRDGYSDIKMKGSTPVNKVDRTSAHNLGFTSKYSVKDFVFDVKVVITYDILNSLVKVSYIVTSDKDLQCKIVVIYNEVASEIPVYLTANTPMETKKVVDLLK